jgi:hypothetical protein
MAKRIKTKRQTTRQKTEDWAKRRPIKTGSELIKLRDIFDTLV